MSFHTIGDSHAKYPWCYIPGIEVHHLGPMLCHTVGKHKHDLVNGMNISREGVKPGDTVCFCFGEIDCRCHVHKFVTANRTYKQVIDDIVKDYFISLMENEKLVSGVRMVVYNVVPPPRKANSPEDQDYPYRGSDDDRSVYARYFNEVYDWHCKELGWTFVNVYDRYADTEGFLSKTYSDGHVHIANPVFIVEAVKGLL